MMYDYLASAKFVSRAECRIGVCVWCLQSGSIRMQERTELGAETCHALDLVEVSFELDALECFCKQVRLLIQGGDFDWSYLPVFGLAH
jgi:hypothetical protein